MHLPVVMTLLLFSSAGFDVHTAFPQMISFADLELDDPPDLRLVPKAVSKLNGQPVIIRGYISGLSMPEITGDRFVLVRDNNAYYPWPVTYNMYVTLREDCKVRFTSRPISVSGTFHLLKRDSEPAFVYLLSEARVIQ